MPSHEERALELVEFQDSLRALSEPVVTELQEAIAQALRTVELEAYERAAKLCEQYRHDAHTFGAVPAEPHAAMSAAAHEISSAIRELAKAKDSP